MSFALYEWENGVDMSGNQCDIIYAKRACTAKGLCNFEAFSGP